jgi:hypothetical protein
MKTLTDFIRAHRSKLLLLAFLALTIASPLADTHPHAGGVIAILFLLALLAGVSYMAEKAFVYILVLPLAALWIVARLVEAFAPGHSYSHIAPVTGFLLSCAVLWAILDRFNSIPAVTGNVVSEAFISYLIIAIAFSQLYWILNRTLDNAFTQSISVTDTSQLLYFSMVTLSTVGYGRIAPVNPYVRIVAGLEAMFGIFFVAVVVARLVSSYGPRRNSRGNQRDDQK